MLNAISYPAQDCGARDARVVLLSNALVMVVREMGNGVSRVESSRLVPLAGVLPERRLPDRLPVDLPRDLRITDLVVQTLSSLGYAPMGPSYVADGFVRFVSDDIFEVSVWLLDAL